MIVIFAVSSFKFISMKNFVSNEIGTLRKILIHSPDSGIGKILPSKLKDWLYDDTVHLQKIREEYDEYVRLLLHFLDPEKAKYVCEFHRKYGIENREIYMPEKVEYFNSDSVIDVQKLLSDILQNEEAKIRLVSAVCTLENCSRLLQNRLENMPPIDLAKVFITGIVDEKSDLKFIFPPIPNLVFTRDIGIMVKDHFLLSKSATPARKRESLIARYVAIFHESLFNESRDKIIEINEDSDFFLEDMSVQREKIITIEGGDIMMISPRHLIVGCSERTSKSAADAIIHRIFSLPDLEIERISIVQIPEVRAQMHIDTIFTQVRRDTWVMYGGYSEKVARKKEGIKRDYTSFLKKSGNKYRDDQMRILQFQKPASEPYKASQNYFFKELDDLEDLLVQVSFEDFDVAESDVKIIYSANNEFPYSEREQWTDSCNLLALKEGVVIGYDRNDKTIEHFEQTGFEVITAKKLLEELENGSRSVADISDTLILLSSSELSRARGGSHCMSCPLNRDIIHI